MSFQLTPELDVAHLDVSIAFYTQMLGFHVRYDRPEERFAFLECNGIQLMLQEASGPGRRFRTAPLEHPYGRGVNFQVEVADVAHLYEKVCTGGFTVVIPLEERWYRVDAHTETGNQQFVVADPDGYLFRLFSTLGKRRLDSARTDSE